MDSRDNDRTTSSDSGSEPTSRSDAEPPSDSDETGFDGDEFGGWPDHDEEALTEETGAFGDDEGTNEDRSGAFDRSVDSTNRSNPTNDLTSDPSSPGMSDEELLEVLDTLETNITVVGCGGAGCNTVNRLTEVGITGAHLVSANTDVHDLVQTDADEKILLGDEGRQDRGRGAGSIPKNGEDAAYESRAAIRDVVDDSDMVFITAGMGGGTGTGSAPVVAEAAQEAGALTISIVTMPFSAEGKVRTQNAVAGINRLQDVSDTLIVIQNDRLLDAVGDLPVDQAFKVADEVLMRSVKGITELITTESLVNLDFADVRTIMDGGGMALVGMGEGQGEYRAKNAITSALRSPMLDADISNATGVLVNVTGGPDMSIAEAEGVVEDIYDRVDPNARIIWGSTIDDDMGDEMRVMLIATGVSPPDIGSLRGEESSVRDDSGVIVSNSDER